jgi:DNA repair photolyase
MEKPNDFDENTKRATRGRGTGSILKSRFETLQISLSPHEEEQIRTQVYVDNTRTIIAYNKSPDVGFNATINAYRGCEHGCIYCYARPTHEYFGLSSGLDFESKIFAKMDAAKLLKKELMAKSWRPQPLGMSGVTDCYQPLEKKLKLTRQCLEVLALFKNPVVIITKNYLVTRDRDILSELASYNAAHVVLSITTLDEELAGRLEPRASTPQRRLQALAFLSEAKIPVSINMAPIIPGLNDHEIPRLLKAAKEHGAQSAHYTIVRLPYAVKDLFIHWLEENYPTMKNKVIHRIEEMRGGALNDPNFNTRMRGEGPYAEHIASMFKRYKNLYNLNNFGSLSCEYFSRLEDQLSLI